MCNLPVAEAINDEGVLEERVREALGPLIGAAREGLLALSVEVGLRVLRKLLEAEVEGIVGPRGKHNPDRVAVRHGHEDGEVTLGGRRVEVSRPRVGTADGESELPLESYEHFADRDQLGDVVLERMLAGVSTRRYRRAQEPVGEQLEDDARSTSKSAVSRMFVDRTRDQLWRLMNRPLSDLRLAVMMLGGIDLHGSTNIVALGITTEGDKLALGLWEDSSENAAVASALLADLVDRGLDVEQRLLFVIDGSKALRKAIRQVFGHEVPVQRCVQHKERNVLDHLPERDRDPAKRKLGQAWQETDHDLALQQLTALALELDRPHLGAAASLREGHGRDPHRDPARRHRQAPAHAAEHEPVRVDDLYRPSDQPQRQELELRRDVPALDRRRDARSRDQIPQGRGLSRARPARHRDRTRAHQPPQQRARHYPRCVTINQGPPSPKFHDQRGLLVRERRSRAVPAAPPTRRPLRQAIRSHAGGAQRD
jgi:putative transposase